MNVNKRSPVVVGALAVLALLLTGVSQLAADGDTRLGTWKLNLAKSKIAGPPPKSQTRKYEPFEGDGVRYTVGGVAADGTLAPAITYSAHYDGKDYPLAGSVDADSVALQRIDAYTVDTTLKKVGKVVQTSRDVVSKDGTMMTLTQKGTNGSGLPNSNVLVFDKQ